MFQFIYNNNHSSFFLFNLTFSKLFQILKNAKKYLSNNLFSFIQNSKIFRNITNRFTRSNAPIFPHNSKKIPSSFSIQKISTHTSYTRKYRQSSFLKIPKNTCSSLKIFIRITSLACIDFKIQ